MANITITSSTNYIDVDFGDYAETIGYDKAAFAKDDLQICAKEYGRDVLKIDMDTRNFAVWYISYDAQGSAFIVDSVDGSNVTSLDDLYDKIKTLM